LEGTIALNALVARFPDLRLNTSVDTLEWNSSILIHGMKALPVKW
jgi:cytochrome P450